MLDQQVSRDSAKVALRRAWISLVLYPVAFVAAFVVGEGLLSSFGYSSGSEESPPFWAVLAAGGPALVVLAVPGALAVWFGRRAMRLGNRSGFTAAVVGATIAVAFVGLNLLSYLAQLIFG